MSGEIQIRIKHGDKIPRLSEVLARAYAVYEKAQELEEGGENIRHLKPFHAYKTKNETVLTFKR